MEQLEQDQGLIRSKGPGHFSHAPRLLTRQV
jgi:hypothetical protein